MNDREIETLAVFVHGAAAGLHALGFFFNARRGQKFDAAVHALVFVYDVVAVVKHARRISPTT